MSAPLAIDWPARTVTALNMNAFAERWVPICYPCFKELPAAAKTALGQ